YECFFFSSRRRHTRSKRDWSSDVCSSDLYYIKGKMKTFKSSFKRAYKHQSQNKKVEETVYKPSSTFCMCCNSFSLPNLPKLLLQYITRVAAYSIDLLL